jgi:hypothetical protein
LKETTVNPAHSADSKIFSTVYIYFTPSLYHNALNEFSKLRGAELDGGTGSSTRRVRPLGRTRVDPSTHLLGHPTAQGGRAGVKRHHTAQQGGQCEVTVSPLQVCWSASRKKRSAFTTSLREEHRGGTRGGKPLGYPADHRTRTRKTGLPAPERSRLAACGKA